MANFSHADSKRKYSWWWDSHISPKNSKWLQENLTDMDAKVKAMIKLIEEDADSFARRAEMYYKKRPELMKLVEEFYRAYRALAERYDHATGALRQAHKTMAEAFPNQIPMMLPDDSPADDPRTPDAARAIRAFFDPDDSQDDSMGRNGLFTGDSDSVSSRKGLKQLNDIFGSGGHVKFAEGRVRKGLNFHDLGDKELSHRSNERHISEAEQVGKLEKEISVLKEALTKFEAEKEAGLVHYQQSLERLSKLDSEVARAQADSTGLKERVSKAEGEVKTLKECLAKLEAEKEASLLQYQQCLEKISNLENNMSNARQDAVELNERVSKAENEAQSLKQELSKVEAEKDAALDQYNYSLEMISSLENRLQQAEEDARQFAERAEKAEKEVEALKQAITKLTAEKEAVALQYQQCLETISSLEAKISSAQDEVQRLNGEIEAGTRKLKDADERCLLLESSNQTLHTELESAVLKMTTQSQELTEKQQELGRLWTCIQEERMRFVEAETAFQTLQHLHAQAQEELRSLTSELQSRAQILRDMETRNQNVQDELMKANEENKSLSELNLSSAMSIKDMQNEISNLTETRGKLQEEVELRVDQRNALQQEIYCLKEELNELNKEHGAILDQVHAVGLKPESLETSVKELQDENSDTKEAYQKERMEKLVLLEKLEILEQLLEKNALLEKSLSNLSAELEEARGKIQALEVCCQSLLVEKSTLCDEKATLMSQLNLTTENLDKLSEKNSFLENSLSDAHDELDGLKTKSKSLEDSCQLLVNQKADLSSENDTLVSQLGDTQQRLNTLEQRYTELEENCLGIEKDKNSTLLKVEELQLHLDEKKQEHAKFVQMTELRLAGMDSQILRLKQEGQNMKKDCEEELDKAFDSQIEIFILQKCVQHLEQHNFSMWIELQKLLEASQLSEKMMSDLDQQNSKQQLELKFLSNQTDNLRTGMHQLLKALSIGLEEDCEDQILQDQIYLNHVLSKAEELKLSLCKTDEQNQQQAMELSVLVTLLGSLRIEAEALKVERDAIDEEFRIKTEQLSVLQNESLKLHEMNEELRIKVREGDQREEALMGQIEILQVKLVDIERAYSDSTRENRSLNEENCVMIDEVFSLGNISLVLKNCLDEKSLELKEINEDIIKQRGVNGDLMEKLGFVQSEFEVAKMENLNLKEKLLKSEDELQSHTITRDQLSNEIENIKKQLMQAEENACLIKNEKDDLQNMMEEMRSKYETKFESLCSELQQANNETDEWEAQAAAFLGELNISTISQALFEEKIHELAEACQSLESVSTSKDADIGILKDRVENIKKQLMQAEENACLIENEKADLHNMMEEMRSKYETKFKSLCSELQQANNETDEWEAQAAAFLGELNISTISQALFEEKIHELAEACQSLESVSTSKDADIGILKDRVESIKKQLMQAEENACLIENEKADLQNMMEEMKCKYETKFKSLCSELQQANNETDEWEAQAAAFLGELNISTISQALFEEKIHELAEACQNLESVSTSRDADIGILKDRVKILEGENEGLKAQLDAYGGAVVSLSGCISSLENHGSMAHFRKTDTMEPKDVELSSNLHESHLSKDPLPDLQDLETRVKSLEKLVTENEQLMIEERLNSQSKLEAALRQIEELKSETNPRRNANPTSEISEFENGHLLTKDIMLDQISECSSYGISRREQEQQHVLSDNHMIGRDADHRLEGVKKHKNGYPVEKELGVDKLELSKRSMEFDLAINKKVLERLNSDVQKLTNLQITVQDLKRKIEGTERNKQGKGKGKGKGKAVAEFDNLKGQLEEAEEAILKLFEFNEKLMKNVEDDSGSPEESGVTGRRRVSDEARRLSERIGRLQLEVQKMQFVLLKIDGEKESKGRNGVPETKRRVLLRDYLYGGGRTDHQKKKGPFCACIQPPTKD